MVAPALWDVLRLRTAALRHGHPRGRQLARTALKGGPEISILTQAVAGQMLGDP